MKAAALFIACVLIGAGAWLAVPVVPADAVQSARVSGKPLSCDDVLFQEEYELISGARCG